MDAGIPESRIIELDLDHATETSLAKLASIVGTAAPPPLAVSNRLAGAFQIIVRHAKKWRVAPSPAEEAQLHLEMAALYRSEILSWRERLEVDSLLKGDVRATLESAAQRVSAGIPQQLRLRPAWFAAGAAAGALGCIAAAAIVFPGAIASLPLWSGAGAAAGQLLARVRGEAAAQHTRNEDQIVDIGDAVRAAALLAILLDLQGCDEAAISRALSQAIPDQEPEPITSENVKRQLDDLHARYSAARQREASS